MQRPEYVVAGEIARLMPVVADTSKEVRATSILLATLLVVPQLCRTLLGPLGQSVGARANLQCFTEVALKAGKDLPDNGRPDGLIVLDRGRGRSWSCLVEAKVGRTAIDSDQVLRYAALAKAAGIDAVLTISNQFAALPTHSPVKLRKGAVRNVSIFHWSWMHVLTEAMLLLNENDFVRPEQRFVLGEMVRYFSHPSIGVSMFDRMNPEWKELVGSIQAGAVVSKSADMVQNSVAAWHQETRDLALLMTRNLRRPVRLRLSRSHRDDPAVRLRDDCQRLVGDHRLSCSLDVPDAAAPLDITADVRRRSLVASMTVAAPADRQRARSRIAWLVRQLSKTDATDIHVRAFWPKRSPTTQALLTAVRADAGILESDNRSLSPTHFEVMLVRDLGARFAGAKTFIEQFEDAVPHFYEQVGQHLRAYVAPPPRVRREAPTGESIEEAREVTDGEKEGESQADGQADLVRSVGQ